MSMIKKRRWFLGLLLFGLMGCLSFHLPTSAPPVYYQLDYQPPSVHCPSTFAQGLRVWRFTSSSPYGRTDMVVVKPDGQTQFSSSFQWIAPPGTMVAEKLLRDLTRNRLFPQVVSANDPATVPLELTGHVFLFASERSGAVSRAALHVEVSLIDNTKPRKVILHRQYDLRSAPFVESTSAAFARAMSDVMRELSDKFQRDLCSVRTGRQKSKR
jgi:ABC-type uncharacterized transport system auxiliary subunit